MTGKLCLVLLLAQMLISSNRYSVVESARILCVFPSPGRSHVLVGQALLKGLAERGHEVTMVSPFKLPKPVKNYREIYIPADDFVHKLSKSFLEKPPNIIKTMPVMIRHLMKTTNDTINDPKFLAIKNEQFDLVITGLFVADFILGFGPHFNAPTVALWSAGMTKLTSDLVGNPRALEAVPHLMIGPQEHMGFVSRFKNFLVGAVENAMVEFSIYNQQKYYDFNFPSNRYPSYRDVRKNVSLVLLNAHFSTFGSQPYLQNVIEVGGLQIKPKPDPLPKDIQEWLDGAEHGAIYFCLGSNLKSSDLPPEKLQIFIKSLGKLKQRILFKWETDSIPNQPANFLTKKWLPQDDILAHKKVVLFISHGGLGGMAESRYHAVPILGIPIFAEQSTNLQLVEKEGWGKAVEYLSITEASFEEPLQEILTNPQYRQKAKELSDLYRDRPQSAMDLACYWIEYVIRYKGAPHMHYQGADLNFFQEQMLDVVAALLVAVYIVFKLFKLLFRALAKLLCSRRKKQKTN
ncbi:UDP-glycosyltransferase UGT5-like [Ochlerotatus camptorhynchus]|uniref:UDP-glycosyltransferase UGT5-like n=1 Tax=Ochlerotatus camptorhynchus TaxID=644619 RepID=UPI0031E0657D